MSRKLSLSAVEASLKAIEKLREAYVLICKAQAQIAVDDVAQMVGGKEARDRLDVLGVQMGINIDELSSALKKKVEAA